MSIPAAGNDVGVGEVGQNIAVAWLTMAAGAAQAEWKLYGDNGKAEFYYDEKTGEVTKAFALGPDNEASYNPALFGAYDVTLADGTAITAAVADHIGLTTALLLTSLPLLLAAAVSFLTPEK